MSRRVTIGVRCSAVLIAACAWLGVPSKALAQTTVVLDAPGSESIDTAIRGGSLANTNFNGQPLATRASDNPYYIRRSLLKFDTETRVPKKASIQKATLTLTVKSGSSETRKLAAYRLPVSFDEKAATWNVRKSGYQWTQAGGDFASKYAEASATATAGSKVTFDVTKLVQEIVNGQHEVSRWTRIAVVDAGSSSGDSYKEFYQSETSDAAKRPTLTVVYGGTTTASPTPSPTPTDTKTTTGSSTSSSTLRVLHWNVHHGGVGTDGRYDPDRLVSWIVKMNPTLISLNEIDNSTQANAILTRLNSKTGVTWKSYYDGRGNQVLSRIGMNSSSSCTVNSGAGRKAAHISVTINGRPLNLWSAHLALDSSSVRVAEAKALYGCEVNWAEARIVAGDFNMQAGTAEYNTMTGNHVDAWVKAKSLGTAYNYSGNCDGCTRNSRIDYVFTSKNATFLTLKSAQMYDTRDANGKMPSDHKPLLVTYAVN